MREEKALGLNPLWVFGYASLIWDPGFPVAERIGARLEGYERSFCMSSIHHRGTETQPGLVLALDACPEAQCAGLALRVAEADAAETIAYLRARELVSSAYLERLVEITLRDGRRVTALTYVIDRDHDQYCAKLTPEEQAQIITAATGGRGPNRDYLWNTFKALKEMNISDEKLSWLAARVTALSQS